MELQVGELRKKDYTKAIQFAIKGMHFNWYLDSPFLLNLYGRYFWYLELTRATKGFAAYADDKFVGVLLAEVKGEERRFRSFGKSLYVKLFDFLQHFFPGVNTYDSANEEMFAHYCEESSPDGEIIFLAADPDAQIKGIGSLLLRTLEQEESGKTFYLYTDNACTYQFYEHRGFHRAEEKDVILELGDKNVDLKCLLYSKTF